MDAKHLNCHCDMPYGVYLDWLEDQGWDVSELRLADEDDAAGRRKWYGNGYGNGDGYGYGYGDGDGYGYGNGDGYGYGYEYGYGYGYEYGNG